MTDDNKRHWSKVQGSQNIQDTIERLRKMNLDALRQAYAEREQARIMEQRVEEVRQLAQQYRREYRAVVNSRGIEKWLSVRSRLGKKFKHYNEIIPGTKRYDPSIRMPVVQNFLDKFSERSQLIPDANGNSYYQKSNLKVGIIADEFNWRYLQDSVNLVYLNLENYRDAIDNEHLDFVLYMSLWRGIGAYGNLDMPEASHYFGLRGITIAALILDYAKFRGLKIVFQSIEDPPSYERYLPIAQKADVIFTSAEEMIELYKRDTGNDNVYTAEFGINPSLHNPVGFLKKHQWLQRNSSTVLFAGSWYQDFKQRAHDTKMIFDGVNVCESAQLVIADRVANDKFSDIPGPGRTFPVKYHECVIPAFQYEDLQKAHKMVDWSINVNSVTDSVTMCARRVYEIQALGGLLLSNYALSVDNEFPGVFTVVDSDEVSRVLQGYSEREIVDMQIAGIRNLYDGCTVYDRLNRIFGLSGIDWRFPIKPVFVIYPEKNEGMEKALTHQSLCGALLIPESQALERLDDQVSGYVVRWDGSGSNAHYLMDMLNAFKFTDAGYVFYASESDWQNAYDFVDGRMAPDDAMFDLAKTSVADIMTGKVQGLLGFSVLAPNRGRDTLGTPKDLAVIVPVYNNGRFLEERCFRSLLRSSIFNRMRIYLVDDGSDDEETLRIVHGLARDYDNVVAYFFDDGGSGSASRPRNKALELGRELYVTYLDPDDEAVGDGYAQLLEVMEREDVDFAFGAKVRLDERGPVPLPYGALGRIDDPRASLVNTAFRPQSVQAGIIKRGLVERAHISFVEGGIGEDTLFFYELMTAAGSVWAISDETFLGRADRRGSVTNDVGLGFFRRSYLCEKAQAEFLKREGLMASYRKLRYDQFMEDWYIEHLSRASLVDLPECAKIVADIEGLYDVCE